MAIAALEGHPGDRGRRVVLHAVLRGRALDWGADVVRSSIPARGDPLRGLLTSGMLPGGTGVNYMVEHANRGKRSVAAGPRHRWRPRGPVPARRGADVYVTSFLPAARRRLRIDVEHLRSINPRLVYAKGTAETERPGPREGRLRRGVVLVARRASRCA